MQLLLQMSGECLKMCEEVILKIYDKLRKKSETPHLLPTCGNDAAQQLKKKVTLKLCWK